MTTKPTEETPLQESDVARLLGVSIHSVRRMRLKGDGPPFYKIGANVRYRRAEVITFFEQKRRTSTSDQGETQ